MLERGSLPRRLIRPGLWVLAIGGVLGLWTLGVPRLATYASHNQNAQNIDIRFVNMPAWVKDDLQARLRTTARDQLTGDPLRRAELVAAGDALLRTGWITRIHQIRRVTPELVQIDAQFAEPFAVVRDAEGDHLVDDAGRLMPRTFPLGGSAKLIPIIGVELDRPANPGSLWDGADLTAALRLLHYVNDKPWRSQTAAIDISGYLDGRPMTLLTDRGCEIVWGRGPNDDIAAEVSTEQKLQYLDYHYSEYGHIDRSFPRRLDISGPVVTGQ
ncbi:MAG: hypothetical protein V3T53_07050 [Phycisphaerales bacterium]